MALNKPVLHKKTPQLVIAQIQIQIRKLFYSLDLIFRVFLREVKGDAFIHVKTEPCRAEWYKTCCFSKCIIAYL